MPGQYLPAARRANLIVRELAEEVLIYDEGGHRAHCLNHTAALVWKHCDGTTTVSGIAGRVAAELSAPVSDEVVWLALDQLAEFDLLAPRARHPAPPDLVSRRRMLRRLGIAAAVSLPLITSIVSPTAQAQSSECNESNCNGTMTCCPDCRPIEECGV